MSDTEATEVPENTEAGVTPPHDGGVHVKTDKRKTRTPKQIEALNLARDKAMELRKSNAELTRKAKEVKKAQREEKRKEVERLYDEMVAKKDKKVEVEDAPSPLPELVHDVKPKKVKKKKPPTPPESETESEEDEPQSRPPSPVKNKHAIKKQVTSSKPVSKIPDRPPPSYKHAFESGIINMMLY